MKNIVEILDTNSYSINIKSDYKNLKKINSYYPTFRNLKLLDKFLMGIEKGVGGSVILSGAYGTGKSHFTSILLNILDKDFEIRNYKNFLGKSEKIYPIEETLKKFEKENYFIVFLDDSVEDFSKGLLLGVNRSGKDKKIKFNLSTNYEVIEKKIESWEKNYRETFNRFNFQLEARGEGKKFYELLQEKDKTAVEIFKDIYRELFSGENFSEVEKTQKIGVLLEEVEQTVLKKGYAGVIYVFDEFGRYLESNINSVDVKEIQDVAEFCNGESKSNLLLITHKDIFQYGEKLDSRDSRNEWEKVSGRFQKEHLIYERTNVLDIISNILIKKNYDVYRNENLISFEDKENLLEIMDNISGDSRTFTEKFYPLDFLVTNILPDLSQKLAQNERTLFAFLCGREEKGLKNLMESSEEKFISLNEIYDYFEDNFKMLNSESSEYKSYIHSKNLLSKLKDEELEEKKFIKILALIYIHNKFSEIEPTPEVIRYALGKKDITSIEEKLREKNLINYRRHYNHYKLVEEIDINVDREVAEYVEKSLNNFDGVDTLENNLKRDTYYPLKYNDEYSMNRYMGQYYIDISNISKIEKLEKNISEDGRIIYLLNLDGNENYHNIAEQLGKQDNIFVTSKSEKKIDIIQELKELEAIDRMIKVDVKYQNDGILKREIESLRDELKERIEKKLKEYFTTKFNLLEETHRYLVKKYKNYTPINYELINKHNLTTPMRKARLDILKRLLAKEELTEDLYFNDTKAESSVARILLKNTNLYDCKLFKLTEEESCFAEIMSELLERIKRDKISVEKLYEIYCSNRGGYGFRKGIFTFLLGVIIVQNYEQVSITLTGSKNEINTELNILDALEKNPEKYEIAYFNITEVEIKYLTELESIFEKFISNREDKIYNRVLSGMKNYVLTLPRYMTSIYLKNYKGLDRTLKSIFSVNNGKEFLLKELPKNYRTEKYEEILEKLYQEITNFENNKEDFVELLTRETLDIVDKEIVSFSELISSLKMQTEENEMRSLILPLEGKGDKEILQVLTQKVKGFSYENWRSEKDLQEYKEELVNLLNQKIEKKENLSESEIKISSSEKEKNIDFSIEETMLGKMLRSKIESTIKNMGMSVSDKEKEKILAKILLDI